MADFFIYVFGVNVFVAAIHRYGTDRKLVLKLFKQNSLPNKSIVIVSFIFLLVL